jgi:hypothetical protein
MSAIPMNYEDKAQVLAEFERRRKARSIAVTVDDGEIRAQLRSLDQPICKSIGTDSNEYPMNSVNNC